MDCRAPQRPHREGQISEKQSNFTRKHPAGEVPRGAFAQASEARSGFAWGVCVKAAGRAGSSRAPAPTAGTDRRREDRTRGVTEFLPHHPLRGSLPRWGKHRAGEGASCGFAVVDKGRRLARRRPMAGAAGAWKREKSGGKMTKKQKETLCKLPNRTAK